MIPFYLPGLSMQISVRINYRETLLQYVQAVSYTTVQQITSQLAL